MEKGGGGQARIWLSVKANDIWYTLSHAPKKLTAVSWNLMALRKRV